MLLTSKRHISGDKNTFFSNLIEKLTPKFRFHHEVNIFTYDLLATYLGKDLESVSYDLDPVVYFRIPE